jgi:hypothetical protein
LSEIGARGVSRHPASLASSTIVTSTFDLWHQRLFLLIERRPFERHEVVNQQLGLARNTVNDVIAADRL